MLDKKFIINLGQVLRHGNQGSMMEFSFKSEVTVEEDNVIVYHSFKILDINEHSLKSKIVIEQYKKIPFPLTEEQIKNGEEQQYHFESIGNHLLDYDFNINKMVRIANNKTLAKNIIEIQFVELFMQLYLKKILSKNFNQKDSLGKNRELFFIDKQKDDQALTINLHNNDEPLFNYLLNGDSNANEKE